MMVIMPFPQGRVFRLQRLLEFSHLSYPPSSHQSPHQASKCVIIMIMMLMLLMMVKYKPIKTGNNDIFDWLTEDENCRRSFKP